MGARRCETLSGADVDSAANASRRLLLPATCLRTFSELEMTNEEGRRKHGCEAGELERIARASCSSALDGEDEGVGLSEMDRTDRIATVSPGHDRGARRRPLNDEYRHPLVGENR